MVEEEFFQRMAAVWTKLTSLEEQEQTILQQMDELTQAGIVNATVHTRNDTGGMELLHPTGSEYERSTGRRREYIGKKAEAQAEALARVERYKTCQALGLELSKTREKIREIKYHIGRLEMSALGQQTKLFSAMGTSQHAAGFQSVPKDWKWLTPQMVIDYFKNSPDLAAIDGDVQEVLSRVAWINQRSEEAA